MAEDILVPLIVFSAITTIFVAWLYFRHHSFSRTQATLQKAIETGQQLSPDLIKAMGVRPTPDAFSDLRKSVILIAIGIATAIFSQFVDEEGVRQLVGIAMFPLLVGVAYFVVYKLNPTSNA